MLQGLYKQIEENEKQIQDMRKNLPVNIGYENYTFLGAFRFYFQFGLSSFESLARVLHCFLGQGTLLSECHSSPSCINGYWGFTAGVYLVMD